MSEVNREDILQSELEYAHISLLSRKIRVLIIGGGRAGWIKCRSFYERHCQVTAVSETFSAEFSELKNSDSVKMVRQSYSKELLKDNHLIVIAVGNRELVKEIMTDCEEESKLYLDCSDFENGLYVVPVQKSTKNAAFSLNTRGGSPKTAKFISSVVESKLKDYEDFVEYSCSLRKKLKDTPFKNEIMDFVSTEDFKFFMDRGKHEMVLKIFYRGDKFEYKNS